MKFVGVMLLTLAWISLTACQTTVTTVAEPAMAKPCPAGRDDARTPVVCVDDSDLRDLRVHPEPIQLLRGATAQWHTRTGRGDLTIVFDNARAFDVTCTPGAGHCRATAAAGSAAGSYKYSVNIVAEGRTYTLDPTVVLVEP